MAGFDQPTSTTDRHSIAASIAGIAGIVQFAVCVAIARSRFPSNFVWSRNFLSELGKSSQPSAFLYNTSVFSLGICLIVFFAVQKQVTSSVFRICGMTSAAGLAGLGLTPMDRLMDLHNLCLAIWLLPMLGVVLSQFSNSSGALVTIRMIGILLLVFVVLYVFSAGTIVAPWTQKLVVVAGICWLLMLILIVMHHSLRIVTRLTAGDDKRTRRYIERLETTGIYGPDGKSSGNIRPNPSPPE
ncbi:MAG: DUF998 domain-containing protein [Planctomycetaceae bacterium]|nr:DUF998 domain-containing protein [Planctomycetaceae bacterium]